MALRATKRVEQVIDNETLEAMVVQDPIRPGLERGRLADYEISVWAIIAHFQGLNEGPVGKTVDPAVIARVAADYHVPERAVHAALAYYRQHRVIIDNFLARNAAAVS
ncbi:MAG: hypothetical protein ACRDJH_13980 [Thermomicrobiales bacterium]